MKSFKNTPQSLQAVFTFCRWEATPTPSCLDGGTVSVLSFHSAAFWILINPSSLHLRPFPSSSGGGSPGSGQSERSGQKSLQTQAWRWPGLGKVQGSGREREGNSWRTEQRLGARGQGGEATGWLGNPWRRAHILVASSSENLPRLISSGGLEKRKRESFSQQAVRLKLLANLSQVF